MKFSILIPTYNVENYIDSCLKQIFEQTYQNFEIIMIDDASTDGTVSQIEKWVKKYPKKMIFLKHKTNQEVSITRNELIDAATGDYFIFVDSDDQIEKNLLKRLEQTIIEDRKPDMIHYGIQAVDEQLHPLEENVKLLEFHNCLGTEAFSLLFQNYNVLESPCVYAYKTNYIKKNKFRYSERKNHEDFGLTPIMLLTAKTVSSIPIVGYYYVQKRNSIMRTDDLSKKKKNANDLLFQFDFLLKRTKKFYKNNQIKHDILKFIIDSLFYKAKKLPEEVKKEFILEIKKRNIKELYYPLNGKEKIKHFIMKCSYELYLKLFIK